jgi:hypothetical protein
MAKDKYHNIVRTALEQDGWVITHDPYKVMVGRRKGYIDIGAELLAAEKKNSKIAIEIKSFLGASDLDQFEDALGQFLVYHFALNKKEVDRILYLAVPLKFYENFFDDLFFVELTQHYQVNMIVFNEETPLIEKWITL